jgi:chromosomal replication initiator protein
LLGPENRSLSEALVAWTSGQMPSEWNPLVVVGPTGSGKSHVLDGLARMAEETLPRGKVLSQSASDFAADYASAVARDALDRFRKQFASLKFWALDDLDALGGKIATQQELANRLDELLPEGVTIVGGWTNPSASTDDALIPRLRSRWLSGLSVTMAPPSPTTRKEMARQFSQELGVPLPSDAADALAEHLPGGPRELLGAIIRMELTARSEGRAIERDDALRLVSDWPETPEVPISTIARETARAYGLKVTDLRGPSRQKSLVEARGLAMHLARELTRSSLEAIGRYFGGRDHSTVLHALRQAASRLSDNPDTLGRCDRIRQRLQVAETPRPRGELVD